MTSKACHESVTTCSRSHHKESPHLATPSRSSLFIRLQIVYYDPTTTIVVVILLSK